MKGQTFLLQDIGRWDGGWWQYSIYGFVLIAIFAFLFYKTRKGKAHKRKNEGIRKEDIENRK